MSEINSNTGTIATTAASSSPRQAVRLARRRRHATVRADPRGKPKAPTMMTLFDLIESAQKGEAERLFGQHFGLSPNQTATALQALLPAFSVALKRFTADPVGFAQFAFHLASAQYAAFYENPMAAFDPTGREQGKALLGQLFKSDEATAAVAAMAAQASGIAAPVLEQMMPVLAAMTMGGLVTEARQTGLAGPFGQMMEAFSGATARAGNPFSEILERGMAKDKTDGNPFTAIFDEVMHGKEAGAEPDNPFAVILQDMMAASAGEGSPEEPAGAPEPDRPIGETVFGQMFEAGRELQDGYQRSMESLVDGYLAGLNGEPGRPA